jgi:hypothetical protein
VNSITTSTETSPAQVSDELESLASSSDEGNDWFMLEDSDTIQGQNTVIPLHRGNAKLSANINSNVDVDLQYVGSDASALGKSLSVQRALFVR